MTFRFKFRLQLTHRQSTTVSLEPRYITCFEHWLTLTLTYIYSMSMFLKYGENAINDKHLMTAPRETVSFVSPRPSMFPSSSPRNKTHCFPSGQSSSVMLYLLTQNRTIHRGQFTTLLQNVTNPSNLHIK